MSATKFKLVDDQAVPDAADLQARQQRATQQEQQATRALMLALAALGQRFVIALSNWFTAGTIAAAWWLWYSVLPTPTILQLVGCGMFAVFILAIEVIRRKAS